MKEVSTSAEGRAFRDNLAQLVKLLVTSLETARSILKVQHYQQNP
jgi:hypothetical protein